MFHVKLWFKASWAGSSLSVSFSQMITLIEFTPAAQSALPSVMISSTSRVTDQKSSLLLNYTVQPPHSAIPWWKIPLVLRTITDSPVYDLLVCLYTCNCKNEYSYKSSGFLNVELLHSLHSYTFNVTVYNKPKCELAATWHSTPKNTEQLTHANSYPGNSSSPLCTSLLFILADSSS